MDHSSNGTNTAGMQMRERRVREHSYHPMASDSEDGGVSDGDPPFYVGASSSSSAIGQQPLAATPTAALPTPAGYTSTRVPQTSNVESLAGNSGGAPTALANPSKKGGQKRSFEELEDIVFSNPKSFATLAFAIAESRGVTLVVSDDRTHKVTSAYMHITCAFRKSGCPFILKLTKAKEGGWVLKGAKALEGRVVDVKQRSIYRCRHPAGAVAEIPSAPISAQTQSYYPGGSTSYPMSTSTEGGVSKPKAARPRSGGGAGGGGGAAGFGNPYERQYESSIGKAASSSRGTPARMTPITTQPSTSMNSGSTSAAAADRALAPPFEPSPFERSMNLQAKIVPVLRGGEPSNGFSAPKGGGGGGRGGYESTSNSPRVGRRGSSYEYDPLTESSLSTVPVIARSDPSALPDWTKLLRSLSPGETRSSSSSSTTSRSRSGSRNLSNSPHPHPSLVPLAQVLAHPYMSLTPTLFFASTTTESMRLEVLEGLPVEKVGVWNKVWAKKILLSREALDKWKEISEEEERERREDDDDEGEEAREEEEGLELGGEGEEEGIGRQNGDDDDDDGVNGVTKMEEDYDADYLEPQGGGGGEGEDEKVVY